jgi:ketosteroid isomerase-like protein
MAKLTIEDLVEIEEIKNLRPLYSHYYDGVDIDALVDLYTDDAICEFGEAFGGDWVGKETIRANFSKFAEGEGEIHSVMHAVTNPWIRLIDADTAHGRWYMLNINTTEGGENPLNMFGIYDDVYKKVDGEWKIHRTRIDFLWPRREFEGIRKDVHA